MEDTKAIALCPVCGEPKETFISVGPKKYAVPHQCLCERQKEAKEREAKERAEHKEEADKWRSVMQSLFGANMDYWRCTFDADDGKDKKHTNFAQMYVKKWDEMRKKGRGVLFCGDTGTGKTFMAACIANELAMQGVKGVIVSMPDMLSAIAKHEAEIMDIMKICPLAVIDDFGAEAQTEYKLEKMFQIINRRYCAGLPTIITTNLRYDTMRSETSIGQRRIYQRILSTCIPVQMTVDRRQAQALDIIKETKEWEM